MILAFSLSDWLHWWQLPIFGAFFLIWLIVGPYLVRGALAKFPDIPKSKRRMGRCVSINVLSSGAGLAAMCVIGAFLAFVAVKSEVIPLAYAAAVLAPAAMLAMAWVVILVMLELPGRVLLRFTLRTSGIIALAALVLGLAAFAPAWVIRQAEGLSGTCVENLQQVSGGLEKYARIHPGQQPANLQVLADEKWVEKKYLKCTGSSREDGFIYLPSSTGLAIRNRPGAEDANKKLIISDRPGSHGKLHVVMYATLRVEPIDEEHFQEVLNLPENKEFKPLYESGK